MVGAPEMKQRYARNLTQGQEELQSRAQSARQSAVAEKSVAARPNGRMIERDRQSLEWRCTKRPCS
jgi:hypothetical protein